MPRQFIRVAAVLAGLLAPAAAQQVAPVMDLHALLARVGERVERYFARAQSLVCTEIFYWQPLSFTYGAEGIGRQVESELRVAWAPTPESGPATEAKLVRQVLRVNGRPPRPNDPNNCTSPEQNTTETQPLSMLLPSQRGDYAFKPAGQRTLDGHRVILIDYKEIASPIVTVETVPNNENCISFDIKGGSRGRVWVDADTFEVLRLDQSLSYVEIPLPRQTWRAGLENRWTMERMDSSIRFKPVKFDEPNETLVLPVEVSSFRVTRGSGTPRLRTTTRYTNYKRFLTGGRVVQPGSP
jgi:hypothetical protein